MQLKNLLLLSLVMLSFCAIAQNAAEPKPSIEKAYEFKIEADSLAELGDFDWEKIPELFENSSSDQEITLIFSYTPPAVPDDRKIQVEGFEVAVNGTIAELETLSDQFRETIETLIELEASIKEK